MKRIAIAALALLLLPPLATCNKDSGTSEDYGFNIYPGTVFYGVASDAGKLHDIAFGGFTPCGPSSTCYAIIYTSVLNGVSYVGIAAEQKTATEVNSMKIWYPGTLTPGIHNMNIASGDNVKAIRKIKATGVTTIYTWDGNAFNVTIGLLGSLYTVTSGIANLNSGSASLMINNMRALRAL